MLALTLTAEMTGVTDLRPIDTEETPFYYMFKVECVSCRETHSNWIGISRFETREMHGSRGEANLVWRCKNCQRESSAVIKTGPNAYDYQEHPKPATILTFECRGCEFNEFKPEGEWQAKGIEKGTPFTAIDLNEGDWFDYDEKTKEEVSIKEMKWEIKREKVTN
ncbi:hypothetical protein EDC01DRAFT_355869 [Geopyxis carbonaria]|nr:hypothetical protein EDC01DRAFT_355869 [Geopyxis carbonaria]